MNTKIIFFLVFLAVLNPACNKKLSSEEYIKLKQAGIEETQKGEFDQAVKKLEIAANDSPNDGEIYPYLAECYENLKQYDKAIETWQKLIYISPRGSAEAEKGLAKLKDLESRSK